MKEKSKIENSETQVTLSTSHRTRTNKTKTTTQNKLSTTDPT